MGGLQGGIKNISDRPYRSERARRRDVSGRAAPHGHDAAGDSARFFCARAKERIEKVMPHHAQRNRDIERRII